MWINSANVPSGIGARPPRGHGRLTNEDSRRQFTGLNHQLTVLPDETVAFYALRLERLRRHQGALAERHDARRSSTRAPRSAATGACHLNNIQYSPDDDTLVFSDLDNNASPRSSAPTARLVWILQRRDRDHHGYRRHLGGRRARHPRPRPRRAPHLQQQQQPRGQRRRRSTAPTTARSRSRSSWISRPRRRPRPGRTRRRAPRTRTTSWATSSASRTATPSSPSRRKGHDRRGRPRAEPCCRRCGRRSNFGYIQKRATLYGPPPR